MPKGSFLSDTFEKLTEFGTSTAKKSAQAVKQTVSPSKLLEQVTGLSNETKKNTEDLKKEAEKKSGTTPLDFSKLQQKYQNQDEQKVNALRNRLFQLVKSGEEKAIAENKKEGEEKKRSLSYEEQEKQRKEEEKRRQDQAQISPQGKVKKSIFSRKKTPRRQEVVETKPSAGKQ